MAIPSPQAKSTAQPPTQKPTQTQQHNQTQRPILSVNVHQQALTQTQLSFPAAMPSLQPKPAATSPFKTRPPTEDPTAPPHSPISPKGIAAKLASMKPYSAPNVMSKPPDPVPIAESDNPDVIALRSALMILQVQRESARRDISQLQKLKEEAVKDPEAYVQELVKRSQLQQSRTSGGAVKEDLLAPTMRYLVDGLGEKSDFLKSQPESIAETRRQSVTKRETQQARTSKTNDHANAKSDSDSESDGDDASTAKFAAVPKEQNIYRMPPVNWAKYQLVGAGLEKLHHDQQTQPVAGKPLQPVVSNSGGDAEPERYVLAAPYEPVLDAVRMGHPSDHPMQTRRKGSKR